MTDNDQRGRAGIEAANKRSLGFKVVLGVLLLAALVGHWLYSYRPRVRSLPGGSAAGLEQLWRSPEARAALWLAYPHQNLGVVEARVGDLDAYLSDLGTVLGGEAVRVPGFGPFRFPPASELVVVSSNSDPQWRGAAEIFPLVAVAARGAGLLTGNPWLAGGSVGEPGERVVVWWRGRRWHMGSLQPGPVPRSSDTDTTEAVVVGRLRAVEDLGRWPAGDYDLIVSDHQVCLGPRALPSSELRGSLENWMAAGRARKVPLVTRETTGDSDRAMLLFESSDGEFPGAVSLARNTTRWKLPGERLLTRLGAEVVESTEGAWTLAAFSSADLELARELLPRFAGTGRRRGWSAVVAAAPASRLSAGIGQLLAEIPVIGESESQSWLALSRLLTPLGETGMVEVVLGDPAFVRLSAGPGH